MQAEAAERKAASDKKTLTIEKRRANSRFAECSPSATNRARRAPSRLLFLNAGA